MENSSLFFFALCICLLKGLVLYPLAALYASSAHKQHVTTTTTTNLLTLLRWQKVSVWICLCTMRHHFKAVIRRGRMVFFENAQGGALCIQNSIPCSVSVVLSPLVMITLSSLASLWLQGFVESINNISNSTVLSMEASKTNSTELLSA